MTRAPDCAIFIARWRKASSSELANAQLFVTELCERLELPRPEPASDDVRDNEHVFERRIQFKHGDGSEFDGRIDCHRRAIHEHGLVSILASLHDELDTCVLEASGWSDLAPALVGKPGGTLPLDDPDEAQAAAQAELLTRLLTLNAERAAEEARGLVRWLRPAFQNPSGAKASTSEQIEADLGNALTPGPSLGGRGEKRPRPGESPAQVRAVADVLAAARGPLSIEQVAARFSGRGAWKVRLPQLLETLTAIGQAHVTDAGYLAAR